MRKPNKTPDHIIDAMLVDFKAGMTGVQIAEKYMLGKSTANEIIKKSGLRVKLAREIKQVRKSHITREMILDAKEADLTNAEAARHYGFTPQGISYASKKFGIKLRSSPSDPWAARKEDQRIEAQQQARLVKGSTDYVPDVTRRHAENDSLPHVPVHPIMATKGEWRALDAYAKARGLTYANAQKLWHKARVGQLVIA